MDETDPESADDVYSVEDLLSKADVKYSEIKDTGVAL